MSSSARVPAREFSEAFQAVAGLTYAGATTDEVHRALVEVAPRLVSGVDHASLMVRRGSGFVTAAATDDVARGIDEAEIRLEEGPCIDAIRDETAYLDPDLAVGSPWPRLTAFVLSRTPVRGGVGVRLVVDGEKVGALNLWSDVPGRLDDTSADEAMVLASFASVAVAAAYHREQAATLRDGLTSNREIGKAIGLLMAFHKVDEAKAWEILRQTSRDLNQKVAAIAQNIVDYHNSPW